MSIFLRFLVFVFIVLWILRRSSYLGRFRILRALLNSRRAAYGSFEFLGDRELFRKNLFALFAKLASVDGFVKKDEIVRIERYMREVLGYDLKEREIAIDIFRKERESERDFISYGTELYERFSRKPGILASVIDALLQIATADGNLTPPEEQFIMRLSRLFGQSELHYLLLRMRYVSANFQGAQWQNRSDARDSKQAESESNWDGELKGPYAVLGCKRDSPLSEVKRSYRKLAKEYHPDRLVAKGLPEEFKKAATRKFREIQEAYEAILKERAV